MSEGLRAAITGLGAFVPEKVLTNSDLEKLVDTSDEWIIQRTGIGERRVVGEGQSTATMAIEAARRACADAKVDPKDLDLIICATFTPDMPLPATSCQIQQALGPIGCAAFDLAAACSGFIYGLSMAARFVEAGQYKKVLVVGAETLTAVTDYQDRGTCILFGDAAGAAIVEPTREDKGVLYSVLCADGGGWDYIHIPSGGSLSPTSAQTVERREHFIRMRGRDVYKFAIEKMQRLLEECMSVCGLSLDDVDLVVPHQVNSRIIESATSKLNFPMDKVYMNIYRYGNTSSASVPVALAEAAESGRIGPGSTVILVAFGAGLTWAGSVVKL